jgi:hypothetical protein
MLSMSIRVELPTRKGVATTNRFPLLEALLNGFIPRTAKKAFDAQDDIESVKRHLENATRLAPNYGDALNNLGTISAGRI